MFVVLSAVGWDVVATVVGMVAGANEVLVSEVVYVIDVAVAGVLVDGEFVVVVVVVFVGSLLRWFDDCSRLCLG